MARFVREYWLWFVVPAAVVAAVAIAFFFFASGSEGPGHYEL